MATRGASARKATAGGKGRDIAVNKTRGLAFARGSESEDWQAIDLKGVAGLREMERVSHIKIGTNWFSVYKASDGK